MSRPISVSVSDEALLASAIDALRTLQDRFFLLLDNAEDVLDEVNGLPPYLEEFILRFGKAKIDTHLVITITRAPDRFGGFCSKVVSEVRIRKAERIAASCAC